MNADPKINIVINSALNASGFRATETQIASITKRVLGLQTAWGAFLGKIGAVTGGVGSLGGLITLGVKYNAVLEKTQTSLAGMLRLTQGEKFKSFQAAFARSSTLIEDLREAGIGAGLSLERMTALFQENTAIMSAANVPLEKQVELLARLAKITTTMTGSEDAGLQLRSMFTGSIHDRAYVARYGLRLTGSEVTHARETGTLYNLLMSRSEGFSGGGTTLAKSLNALKEALAKLTERETLAAFNKLSEFAKYLGSPQARKSLDENVEIAKTAGYGLATAAGAYGVARLIPMLPGLLARLAGLLGNPALIAFLGTAGWVSTGKAYYDMRRAQWAQYNSEQGLGAMNSRQMETITAEMNRRVQTGQMSAADRDAWLAKITGATGPSSRSDVLRSLAKVLIGGEATSVGGKWSSENLAAAAEKYRDLLFDQMSATQKLAELERQRAAVFQAMVSQPGGQGTSAQFMALLDLASKRRELVGGLFNFDVGSLMSRASDWTTRGFLTAGEAFNSTRGMADVRSMVALLEQIRDQLRGGVRMDMASL